MENENVTRTLIDEKAKELADLIGQAEEKGVDFDIEAVTRGICHDLLFEANVNDLGGCPLCQG